MQNNTPMVCLICGKEQVWKGLHDLLCHACGSVFRSGMRDAGYGVRVPMTDDEARAHYAYKLSLLQLGECAWGASNLAVRERAIRDALEKLEN